MACRPLSWFTENCAFPVLFISFPPVSTWFRRHLYKTLTFSSAQNGELQIIWKISSGTRSLRVWKEVVATDGMTSVRNPVTGYSNISSLSSWSISLLAFPAMRSSPPRESGTGTSLLQTGGSAVTSPDTRNTKNWKCFWKFPPKKQDLADQIESFLSKHVHPYDGDFFESFQHFQLK